MGNFLTVRNKTLLRSLCVAIILVLLITTTAFAGEPVQNHQCTNGGAMGNAIINGSSGRPIIWRDYDWPGHPFPVTLNKVTGGTHAFIGTSEDPGYNFGGLNDAGLAMFNTLMLSLAKPGSPAEYEELIDCGSATFTDFFGADQAYTTSNHAGYIDDSGTSATWSTTGTVTNDYGLPNAMKTYRYSTGNFRYRFDNLPSGTYYRVRLYFAENYYTSSSDPHRIFNIKVNNDPLYTLNNFDLWNATGGYNKGYVQEFRWVPQVSGRLDIQFETVQDSAEIDAILIERESTYNNGDVQKWLLQNCTTVADVRTVLTEQNNYENGLGGVNHWDRLDSQGNIIETPAMSLIVCDGQGYTTEFEIGYKKLYEYNPASTNRKDAYHGST